jgi:phosphonate transport system substrate-binding protein
MKRSLFLVLAFSSIFAPISLFAPIAQDAPISQGAWAQTPTKSTLTIGAIPDQDPEKLQRLYGKLTQYLEQELQVPVVYKPVTDYTAAVTAFRVGDLNVVWFGGLTGVQARLQVKGAQAIAQRDIDAKFQSVFIANQKTEISAFKEVAGLQAIKGRSLTFGSESSTSGRLMPQFFIEKAGLKLTDLKGQVGFSGNHDATIKLVEAGTFEIGALNSQVWDKRVAAKEVDTTKVQVIFRTPTYYDYHWVARPDLDRRFGKGFTQRFQNALLKLDSKNPEQKEILELFGANRFISTNNQNYAQIEAVGRAIGKIR